MPVAQPSEAQHSANGKCQMPDAKCLSAWETKDGERVLAATAALGHGRLACNTTTSVVVRAHTSPRWARARSGMAAGSISQPAR